MSRPTEDGLLVAFASAWEPYGGADASDIFVEFGIGLHEYRDRLNRALTREIPPGMTTALHRRLLRYAACDLVLEPTSGGSKFPANSPFDVAGIPRHTEVRRHHSVSLTLPSSTARRAR